MWVGGQPKGGLDPCALAHGIQDQKPTWKALARPVVVEPGGGGQWGQPIETALEAGLAQ